MGSMREGQLLWQPSPERQARSTMGRYMRWLGQRYQRHFADYDELWQWSVTDLEAFWASVWEFCDVVADRPYTRGLADDPMAGARGVGGAELGDGARRARQ